VLRGTGRSAGLGSAGWLRGAVVVGEVAMCFVLLVGSGLMFRSFRELQRIDPGFDGNHLMTFLINGRNARTPEARLAFIREFNTRLRAIPGVQGLTASTPFPLAGGYSPIRWGLEGALSDPSRFQAVDFQSVLPGYFETVRTPLIAGRGTVAWVRPQDAAEPGPPGMGITFEELTPESVQSYSKIHLRCGTAFLLWVMVIAVFVFALVGRPAWPILIASRVLLLPVIAGLAYELIRFGARHPDNPIVRKLLAPGLWLQSLTTREPTLDQVEVSINALRDVLAAEERSQAERGVSRVEVMA
jgi:hypothetical protein